MSYLQKDVQYIKGIGPKKSEKLKSLGINTLKDLLYYFPRTYEDRSIIKKIFELRDEEKVTIKAVVTSITSYSPKRNMNIVTMFVKDETGSAKLTFFNRPYIINSYKKGDSVLVFGKVSIKNGNIEMSSCEIEYLSNSPKHTCKLIPVYPLTFGVSNSDIANAVNNALDSDIEIDEYIPRNIIEKYNLCDIEYAIKNIHRPVSKQALKISLYRLIFEEFLVLQLGLFIFKNGNSNLEGIKFSSDTDIQEKIEEILNSLPYRLTKAQKRTLDDILSDMGSNKVMNRLVQGDVGSGKTVVSMIALANAVVNGYQGAIMVPTEILAKQHFESFTETLSEFGIRVEILIGSLTKKQKDVVKEKIKNGEVDIVVGTHALIQDNVEFSNIGLVVTDEQHRFGVLQRAKLSNKGKSPDVLVMTATPIPRTLAIILYGDLDISIIDELPPGRKKIDTIAIQTTKRDFVYRNLVRDEVNKGRQVYIVCSLVEESEVIEAKAAVELVEDIRERYFSDLEVGLVHGKMKPKEKEAIMEKFRNNEINILVSTTVIEVGVNVPNATLMIIENAERFGLSQLHQLRGRVGRGSDKSYCVLIFNSKTEVCKKRMEIMCETNDGFKIAEKDLEIRGPGDFFGTRQHGLPDLKVANLFKHIKILKLAQKEARYITGIDKNLDFKEHKALKKEILEKFSGVIDNILL
ncbi:MAG: ATP-dependent DNA helicase RecG [Clostridioides sp.]|jgi:ATP-dependent DNA helicase RecG|nr:ATP-dependent DNA helicase RecG [Clostridioides sp.]